MPCSTFDVDAATCTSTAVTSWFANLPRSFQHVLTLYVAAKHQLLVQRAPNVYSCIHAAQVREVCALLRGIMRLSTALLESLQVHLPAAVAISEFTQKQDVQLRLILMPATASSCGQKAVGSSVAGFRQLALFCAPSEEVM